MDNAALAATFDKIADLLEINGEVVYKTIAYRRAAENLRTLGREAALYQAEGTLTEIPGVGKAIAEKIDELLNTGKLGFLERLEQEVPPTLLELLKIPDVGPKKAALFWKKVGVTSLDELEKALDEGKLRDLPGMGEKSEQRVREGIAAIKRRTTRLPLGTARPVGLQWVDWLRGQPGVTRAEIAGSLRRWRSTIGDIDLIASADDPKSVMKAFTTHPQVLRVLGQGEAKSSVELAGGVNIQLWIQPAENFGSLWQFVSGSKDHNVHLRELAQRKGLSLSEHGLADENNQEMHFSDEPELYKALGLDWIPPELREDNGEIQAAQAGKLPRLVQVSDLQAELHSHSIWSDGNQSIREMAAAARQRGLSLLAVTDHSQSLGIANGLTPARLRSQRAEIDKLQAELGDEILLLQGAEIEIKADGSLDYPDDVLAELDIVIASLHVALRQPRKEVTERLIKAMRNPNVDIIGHPSGRLLPEREGADLDWEAVLKTAKETGVALEINAHPSRLDLDDVHARVAGQMGILLTIDTDAHSPADLDNREYGVSVARRAWIEPSQVINTWSSPKIRDWLKNPRN